MHEQLKYLFQVVVQTTEIQLLRLRNLRRITLPIYSMAAIPLQNATAASTLFPALSVVAPIT